MAERMSLNQFDDLFSDSSLVNRSYYEELLRQIVAEELIIIDDAQKNCGVLAIGCLVAAIYSKEDEATIANVQVQCLSEYEQATENV